MNSELLWPSCIIIRNRTMAVDEWAFFLKWRHFAIPAQRVPIYSQEVLAARFHIYRYAYTHCMEIVCFHIYV